MLPFSSAYGWLQSLALIHTKRSIDLLLAINFFLRLFKNS